MEKQPGKVKVKRSRKRVYEAAAAEPAADLSVPTALAAETVTVASEPEPVGATARTQDAVQRTEDERYAEALTIVRGSAGWSAGAGLIPLPLADMAALMLLQLRMLKQLSRLYDVPFSTQRAKAAVVVLLTGLNTAWVAGSSAKILPFIGILALAAMPAVNGALTYAVGRVFIQHFASGGTFLDFDPATVKAFFEQQYREAESGHAVKVSG